MEYYARLNVPSIKKFIRLNKESDTCIVLTIGEKILERSIGDFESGAKVFDFYQFNVADWVAITQQDFYEFVGKFKMREREVFEETTDFQIFAE